jgi:nitrous oxidase accessory protein
VVVHGAAARSTFRGNAFRDNLAQVRVDGGDNAMAVEWRGNDFDDYRGYDFDGDGIGDVPYELRSLSLQMTTRHPNLQFLRGTPSLWLLDASSEVLPLFQPDLILVDPTPAVRLGEPWREVSHAR